MKIASPDQPVTPILVSTDLAVGPNRFALGLIDRGNQVVAGANVRLTFFEIEGKEARPRAEATTSYREIERQIVHVHEDGQRHNHAAGPSGVYVVDMTFDQAGPWGVEAIVDRPGEPTVTVRLAFPVAERSQTPAIGSPAPRSRNLTAKDVADLRQIDTSAEPTVDLHTTTIADAIAAGRPLVVVFATPGYCASAICASELDVARELHARYRDRVEFVHVEIYKDPTTRTPADAVVEWNLPSDPWFFLVDRKGLVFAKFEGPTTRAELEAALERMLKAS